MRLQRGLSVLLIALALPVLAQAAAFEMLTITSGAAVGITAGLCTYSPPGVTPISEHGLFVQLLDASVYYTVHAADATPSASLGGVTQAGDVVTVGRASEFRAIAVSSTARGYAVCVPK